MYYSSGNYEAFARPKKPADVDNKHAYIMVPDWRHCLQPVIWCVMVRCLARTSTSLRRTRYPAAPVTVLIFPALAM